MIAEASQFNTPVFWKGDDIKKDDRLNKLAT